MVEAFRWAKTLRENADYYGEFSKLGAKNMLDKAEEFLIETKKILRVK